MVTERPSYGDYPHHATLDTRWSDNDLYGHVNNVVYYSYFDSVANAFLVDHGLDIHGGPVVGLVVSSGCSYHAPVAYPETLRAGFRVDRLGTSSVAYGIGIFSEYDDRAVAHGHVVHVFVDRDTRRPTPIPDDLRAALASVTV